MSADPCNLDRYDIKVVNKALIKWEDLAVLEELIKVGTIQVPGGHRFDIGSWWYNLNGSNYGSLVESGVFERLLRLRLVETDLDDEK